LVVTRIAGSFKLTKAKKYYSSSVMSCLIEIHFGYVLSLLVSQLKVFNPLTEGHNQISNPCGSPANESLPLRERGLKLYHRRRNKKQHWKA